MSGTDATDKQHEAVTPRRTILVRYVGGPKDGEVSLIETGELLPIYSMVLATEGQPYLIRRKLTAAIYRFDHWREEVSEVPEAEVKYIGTQDHTSAHEVIQSHAAETVPVPEGC